MLRGPTYGKPFRGIRTQGETDLDLTISAAAYLLPDGAGLTGWSALRVRGLPGDWVDGRGRGMQPLPVRVEAPPGTQPRLRPGLDVVRRDAAIELTEVAGLPVASAPVAWLTEIARTRDRVVAQVLTDAVLRFGLASAEDLAQLLAASAGRRGVRLARRALELADPWAESPRESEFRVYWVDTGLGRPLANQVVLDREGNFLGRTDLLDEAAGVAGEFNGAWHREGLQPWSDEVRLRGLRGIGLEVAVVGGPDLHRGGLGAKAAIRQTYALAARRPPFAPRWQLGARPPLPWQRHGPPRRP